MTLEQITQEAREKFEKDFGVNHTVECDGTCEEEVLHRNLASFLDSTIAFAWHASREEVLREQESILKEETRYPKDHLGHAQFCETKDIKYRKCGMCLVDTIMAPLRSLSTPTDTGR